MLNVTKPRIYIFELFFFVKLKLMSILFQCQIMETCQYIYIYKVVKKKRLFDLGSFETTIFLFFIFYFYWLTFQILYHIIYCYREMNGRAYCEQAKHCFCDMYDVPTFLYSRFYWHLTNDKRVNICYRCPFEYNITIAPPPALFAKGCTTMVCW